MRRKREASISKTKDYDDYKSTFFDRLEQDKADEIEKLDEA